MGITVQAVLVNKTHKAYHGEFGHRGEDQADQDQAVGLDCRQKDSIAGTSPTKSKSWKESFGVDLAA